MLTNKKCCTCGETKPASHFYIKSKKYNTLRSDCKICYSNKASERYRKPKYSEARKRAWRKYQRYKLYGITEDDYNKMNESQGSRCLICGTFDDNLYIDHCHTSGKVRGLLCNNCNSGLGKFKDSTDLLEKAIEYLRI